MSRETSSKAVKQHGAFSRVLAFLLLGFIFYGTTIEAAHTHGTLAASNSVAGVTMFSDPATETNAGNTLPGCDDCLICQLHQGFSATLISAPPGVGSSALRSLVFNASAVLVHSETTIPRRGRAPPSTL